MNEPYSIFLPSAPKDFERLPLLLDSIQKNLSGFQDIIFCIPWKYKNEFCKHVNLSLFNNIHVCAQEYVLPEYNPRRIKYRPNWILQMYLKLFQNVTQYDLYLTLDTDVLFNRPMSMFTEQGKRILWMGWEQNYRPYFEFQEQVFHLPRTYPHTFINDSNFMDKKILKEMFDRNGYSITSFLEKSYSLITENCHPAENEIWGQYVAKYHLDKYEIKQAKTYAEGKPTDNFGKSKWSLEIIKSKMEQLSKEDYDMIMFHNWFTTNEVQK